MQYKWRALGVVAFGTLMAAIDGTVVIIAFPQIARDLHASLVEMVWVLMVYILMGTALVLSLGRVADMQGRKRLYSAGFLVFIAGSVLCALAQTGTELVAFRAVQGVGGAMLFANSFALLSDAFPASERGRAFGLNTVVWGGGSIVGILVGAAVLSVTTWRWIFWINVPIGLAGTVLALLFLRESVTPDPRESFDFPAAALFTSALASALFGVTEGILSGWASPIALVPLVASLPLLAAFVVWERYASRDPILPLSLFRSWMYSASMTASVLQGLALFAANFLIMVYYQGILGTPIVTAALLLVPLSAALVAVSPLGGRLSDRFGARVVSTIGLLVQAGALFLFSTISASTPLVAVAAYEAILGTGGGLFFPANAAAIMGGVPRARYGVASGAMMTLRNSSMALSYAIALVALTSQLPSGFAASLFGGAFSPAQLAADGISAARVEQLFLGGMSTAFRVASGLVVVAAVFSAVRGRERRVEATVRRTHRPSRSPFVHGPPPLPLAEIDPGGGEIDSGAPTP